MKQLEKALSILILISFSTTQVAQALDADKLSPTNGLFQEPQTQTTQQQAIKQSVQQTQTTKTEPTKIIKEVTPITNIDVKASLKICGLGSCTGDVGNLNWRTEASIKSKDAERDFKWSTNSNEIKNGLLEVYLSSPSLNSNAKPIYKQNVTIGTFSFDLSTLKTPDVSGIKSSSKNAFKFTKSILEIFVKTKSFPLKINKSIQDLLLDTYFIRVIPVTSLLPAKASNEVKVVIDDSEDKVIWQKVNVPKIYDINIVSFDPLKSPDIGVCSNAMILDTPALMATWDGAQMKVMNLKAGDRICPQPYKGMGGQSWYESLWNFVSGGLAWVSEAYNDIKSAIVNAVGSVVCGGNSDCKNALAAGLDMGLIALGIPPTIPNFDQLMDQGFDYLAAELSSQAGCPDQICKDKIKDALRQTLAEKKNPDPGCMDKAMANANGFEPLCLPKGVKAHWDSAAINQPAKIVIEVKRNNVDAPVGTEKIYPYKIILSSYAYNADFVGQWIKNIPPYDKSIQITAPLKGDLFKEKILEIPELAKGQSVQIPLVLTAEEYWVPGHLEAMKGWTTTTIKDGWPQYQYDDWWRLYYGADLSINAIIYGCSAYLSQGAMGGSDCLVSTDSLEKKLPYTLNQY